MSYAQTEAIILEQLKLGNYTLRHNNDDWFQSLKLVIPKNGSRPKISIEFSPYFWIESEERYAPWSQSGKVRIEDVWLSSWRESQKIGLYNEDLKAYLLEIDANYWLLETEKRRQEIVKEDKTWAARFKEAFK